MKKMISLITFLFIIYFGIQALFAIFGKGHNVNYKLKSNDNVIYINENYNSNGKDENSYTLTLTVDDAKFNYIVYHDFKNSSEIIKRVSYFKDNNYKCIFVKYRNDVVLNDILCHNGEYIIPYHNIVNASDELKQNIENLTSEGYIKENYMDDKSVVQAHVSLVLYSNNHITDQYVSVAENRKLYKIYANGDIIHNDVFKSFEPIIHAFVGDNYVSFNSTRNDATEYQIYSMTSTFENTITSSVKIGEQTVLGAYGNSVYVYDNTNQKEYEIDLDSEKILEVGSAQTRIKYYEGGEWKHVNYSEYDINKIDFGSKYKNDYEDPKYAKIIKRGYEVGYYYYFKYNNGRYDVYRSTIEDRNNLTYLFTTDSISSVKFVGEYIYYIKSSTINHYSDNSGNRTLLYLDGLKNNTLYNIYVKK